MKKVRAAVLRTFGKIEIEEFPLPEVTDNGMLVKMRMVGICGTDKHLFDGKNKELPLPIILGHENLGEVAEIGKSASSTMEVTGKKLQIGDRVTWFPAIPCGKCWYCRWLGSNYPGALCSEGPAYGINMTCANAPHLFGGYAEYVYILPGTWVWKIPDDLPDEIAVLTDIFSVLGVITAMSPSPITKRGFGPGDSVVIQGAGPMGFASGIIAKLAGAYKVFLIGGPKQRLELANEMGVFEKCIDLEEVKTSDERVKLVKTLIPGGVGPDLVIDCTGVPDAVPEGLEMLRRGGTFVEVGSFLETGETKISPFKHLCWKSVNLIGNFGGAPHSYDSALRFIQMARKAGIPLHKLVTHTYPLEQAQKAMEDGHRLEGLKLVLTPK